MVTIRQALCGLFLVAGTATLSGQNISVTSPAASASGAFRHASAGPAAANRNQLTYYTQSISQGMFGAPIAAPALPPKAPAPRKPKPPRRTAPPALTSDPMADYTFTGIVTMQGRLTALIEHKVTRAGTYLQIGDRFLNGQVMEIDGRQITLTLNGTKRALARFENYQFTPLDASASFLGGGTGSPVSGSAPSVPGQIGQSLPPPPPVSSEIPSFPLQQADAELHTEAAVPLTPPPALGEGKS